MGTSVKIPLPQQFTEFEWEVGKPKYIVIATGSDGIIARFASEYFAVVFMRTLAIGTRLIDIETGEVVREHNDHLGF